MEGNVNVTTIRILRPAATADKLGVNRSTVWRYSKRADFPKAVRIGPGAVGYIERELDEWISRQRQERDNA
jgi:prophage regulatory protein